MLSKDFTIKCENVNSQGFKHSKSTFATRGIFLLFATLKIMFESASYLEP